MPLEPVPWQPTLSLLFARYQELIRQAGPQLAESVGAELASRTIGLCVYAQTHLHEIQEDKANRWLGFVQGVVISAGLATIDGERDFTRPLFHKLKGFSPSHEAIV